MTTDQLSAQTSQELQAFISTHGEQALRTTLEMYSRLAEVEENYRVALLAQIEHVLNDDQAPEADATRLYGDYMIRRRYGPLFPEPRTQS